VRTRCVSELPTAGTRRKVNAATVDARAPSGSNLLLTTGHIAPVPDLWSRLAMLALTQRAPFFEEEIVTETLNSSGARRVPGNKGRLTGQKPPLKFREIWVIRTRLQMSSNARELAMFNLAIDSKLRACDLTRLQVQDVCTGGHVVTRTAFMQQKTQRPVQSEITDVVCHGK
jgi:hypothetical protein